METLIWSGVFVVGLAALVKASDWFITASVTVGRSLGLPPFVIGVLLIGFGTSLPELVSSIFAVKAGSSEIVVGNVLGSNITNILLILGLAAVIGGSFRVKTDLLKFDLPVMAGGAFVLGLMLQDGRFSLGEGLVCLGMLGVYLGAVLKSGDGGASLGERPRVGVRTWVKLVASPILIFFGAKFVVDSVIFLADVLGIGPDVIALSAVALGTSLPEIVVAVTAARRGQPELIVGNIVGSNIFNTFAVMGIPSLLGTLSIPADIVTYSLPVFIAATLLYVIITVDRRVTRAEGTFLIAFYVFFLGRLFGWV